LSSTTEYRLEVEAEQADKWIRDRLENKDASKDSEEYLRLAAAFSELQEYLEEQHNFEAELRWLEKPDHQFIIKALLTSLRP
jgi:hypothetical protein